MSSDKISRLRKFFHLSYPTLIVRESIILQKMSFVQFSHQAAIWRVTSGPCLTRYWLDLPLSCSWKSSCATKISFYNLIERSIPFRKFSDIISRLRKFCPVQSHQAAYIMGVLSEGLFDAILAGLNLQPKIFLQYINMFYILKEGSYFIQHAFWQNFALAQICPVINRYLYSIFRTRLTPYWLNYNVVAQKLLTLHK